MVSSGRSNRLRVGFERSGSAGLVSTWLVNANEAAAVGHTDKLSVNVSMLHAPKRERAGVTRLAVHSDYGGQRMDMSEG